DDEPAPARREKERDPLRGAEPQGEGRLPGARCRVADHRGRGGRRPRRGDRDRPLHREPDRRQVLTLDYATFIKQAERGEPPAITLLHGGDVQLLDDALDAATRGLFPDRSLATWGREVFDGRESSADDIVRAAATMPLGVDRRLVAVRRPQALAAKSADTLGGYAKRPNPATCLLLLADEPLPAPRQRRSGHWPIGAVPAP